MDFFLTLIQRDKVKLMCVTLIDSYLRAPNRSSINLYRLVIKIYLSIYQKKKFVRFLHYLFSGILPAMLFYVLLLLISPGIIHGGKVIVRGW